MLKSKCLEKLFTVIMFSEKFYSPLASGFFSVDYSQFYG